MVEVATIFQTILQVYQTLNGTPDATTMFVLFLVAAGLRNSSIAHQQATAMTAR